MTALRGLCVPGALARMRRVLGLLALLLCGLWRTAQAQPLPQVIDIPTRPAVSQRVLLLVPESVRAWVLLFPGGNGGLQLDVHGQMRWGSGNFLVRSRDLFAREGLAVAVLDSPSDRQQAPFLEGFRQTAAHQEDVVAVLAALRQRVAVPVWLVGTSRGTESAAYLASALTGAAGPDGVVLTSSILRDVGGRALPDLPLHRIRVPVLVVHHEDDGCRACRYSDMPALMQALASTPRAELVTFRGGLSQGNLCGAFAHHGYNGIEADVVARIGAWIRAMPARQP